MDLYTVLLDLYIDYNLEQITAFKSNIRKILYKILSEKLIKYFWKIEIFYHNLVFKILGKVYCVDKNLLNKDFVEYVNTQLEILNLNGVINKQKIQYFIDLFEESLIKSSAFILYNFKQLEEEEVNTIGQIDLQPRSKQEACH